MRRIMTVAMAALLAVALLAAPVSAKGEKPGESIVEIASGNSAFSTLVAAVVVANAVFAATGRRLRTLPLRM